MSAVVQVAFAVLQTLPRILGLLDFDGDRVAVCLVVVGVSDAIDPVLGPSSRNSFNLIVRLLGR